MNLAEQLLVENSRKNWNLVIDYLLQNPNKIKDAIDLFIEAEYRVNQRISQVIGIVGEKKPELILPYWDKILQNFKKQPIDAFKRNVFRILSLTPIPEKHESKIFDLSLKHLQKFDEPIAVKVFCMTVLRKICQKYPDLTQEVIFVLEELLEKDNNKGIQSRGRREMKILVGILK